MSSMRLTASPSSKIKKLKTSPIKKLYKAARDKSVQRKKLETTKLAIDNVFGQPQVGKNGSHSSGVSNSANTEEPLLRVGPAISAFADLSKSSDSSEDSLEATEAAIDAVLAHMWDKLPENNRGMSRELPGEVLQFRQFVPPIVLVGHLYAVFRNRHTFVDRQLVALENAGRIKRIACDFIDGAHEALVKTESYFRYLSEVRSRMCDNGTTNGDSTDGLIQRFQQFLTDPQNSRKMRFHAESDIGSFYATLGPLPDGCSAAEDIAKLLAMGVLIISSEPQVYELSVPGIGSYSKLVVGSRNWVLKLLRKRQFREMVESAIVSKYDYPLSRMKWKVFRGANIHWVLAECYGNGWCEVFDTPTGRAWKLTGKK